MKAPNPFEASLQLWGRLLGEHGDGPDGIPRADQTRYHALVRAADFPPGSASGRSARSMSRLRQSPTWGFEPVVCTETRTHRISTPEDLPLEVRQVQKAFERLNDYAPELARVLLANYHRRGPQADKAEDLGIPLRRYKDRLRGGRAGMMIFLSDM